MPNDSAGRKKPKPRCPKCGYKISWAYEEEAGFGIVWCLRYRACGWEQVS